MPAPERLNAPDAAVATAETGTATSNASMQAAMTRPGAAPGGTLQTLAAGAGNRAVQRMVAAQRLESGLEGTEAPTMFNMPDVALPAGGGGSAIPDEVRGKMESAFGHDFSDVRVHEGQAASSVGALAYTQGSDIHFKPGQYSPGSTMGQEKLGHELAHVVQQRSGRVAAPHGEGAPINADPSLEAEADALGRQAAHSAVSTAPTALQTASAGAETAVQGLGLMDRFRAWWSGKKGGDAAPAAPEAAPIAAPEVASAAPQGNLGVGGGGGGALAAAAAAQASPQAAPAPEQAPVTEAPAPEIADAAPATPEAAAAESAAESQATNARGLPEGSEAILSTGLNPQEIQAAAAEAEARGPAFITDVEAVNEGAEPGQGAQAGPPPRTPDQMADAIGVPRPSETPAEVTQAATSEAATAAAGPAPAPDDAQANAQLAQGNLQVLTAMASQQGGGSAPTASPSASPAPAASGGIGTTIKNTLSADPSVVPLALGGISTGISAATRAVNPSLDMANAAETAGYAGGIGGVLGGVAGVVKGGQLIHEAATSAQGAGGTTETALEAASTLSGAGGSIATGAAGIEAARAGLMGSGAIANAVMTGAATASAGFSVATGSIDVIRGVGGAAMATSRARQLDAIAANNQPSQAGHGGDAGVASTAQYAASQQRAKRTDKLITAGKGALAVAGGAVLLAAGLANPIGLGLLAGAAVIGGGLALYRLIRKKLSPTGAAEHRQRVAERQMRAQMLLSQYQTNDQYKQILLSIGISADRIAKKKVSQADIEKALLANSSEA